MIEDKITIKVLTKEERQTYRGPAKEAAREVFGVDVFDDEKVDTEIFPESNQDGYTLPVLRQYISDGNHYMYMIICTDEQLATLRTLNLDEIVTNVPEDVSEDVMERHEEPIPLRLGEVNCFFTETGVHSLDPVEETDSEYYVETCRWCDIFHHWRYEVKPNQFNKGDLVHKSDLYKQKREVLSSTTSTVFVPVLVHK